MIHQFSHFAAEILRKQDLNVPQVQTSDDNVRNAFVLVFSILGAVAFLVITIAGFRYSISQGDPTKTANAKNTIIYASVGLIVAASAAIIVKFVLGRV